MLTPVPAARPRRAKAQLRSSLCCLCWAPLKTGHCSACRRCCHAVVAAWPPLTRARCPGANGLQRRSSGGSRWSLHLAPHVWGLGVVLLPVLGRLLALGLGCKEPPGLLVLLQGAGLRAGRAGDRISAARPAIVRAARSGCPPTCSRCKAGVMAQLRASSAPAALLDGVAGNACSHGARACSARVGHTRAGGAAPAAADSVGTS